MARVIFSFALLMLMFGVNALAHSIRFTVSQEPPSVIVQAAFSRTSPLVNAKVEIFEPGNEKLYQTGRTDKQGRFAFLPDKNGLWKVSVDDGMGHYDLITINVSEAFFKQEEIVTASGPEQPESIYAEVPLVHKVIFGLALIFGLTGIIYGIKARKLAKA
jgi:nickel transport protein